MGDLLRNLRAWWGRRNSLGARGERAAAAHLRRAGYKILARNLRTKLGEIDIVAEDRASGAIVIVEVKAAAAAVPQPEQHVNLAKQRKLSLLAAGLVRRYRLENRAIRFDVIGVVWPAGDPKPQRLTHHISAFQSTR